MSVPPSPSPAAPPGLRVLRVPLDSLHEDPSNARSHDDRNLTAIEASLQRFGQAEPLVVQRGTRRVIAGNGRLQAMRKLGWPEAEIVEIDIDDLNATALGIALNRTAELAGWDDQTLGRLLEELRTEDALDGVGFGEDELEDLLRGLDDGTSSLPEDAVPEPLEEPVSRRGDLWLLGDHRVLCGDAAERGDVARLLAGEPVQLVNTDPPYNVRVEPRSNNAIAAGLSSFPKAPHHHQAFDVARDGSKAKRTTPKLRPKDRPLINDFMDPKEFQRLLGVWFKHIAMALRPGGTFYIWGGYANCANYPPAMVAAKLYFSQAIIWVKEHPVLTRKDFMGNHEWCFYGWKEGAGHRFLGPTNVTDVWSVKKVNPQAMAHLTEKPVELAARALECSSRRGDRVLDLFGGSGSTLMACDHGNRQGLLMELDPIYCDVILRRWQEATGKDALLEESGGAGRRFAAVAESRGVEVPS